MAIGKAIQLLETAPQGNNRNKRAILKDDWLQRTSATEQIDDAQPVCLSEVQCFTHLPRRYCQQLNYWVCKSLILSEGLAQYYTVLPALRYINSLSSYSW